jgi:hypothetical protein
LNLNNIQLNSHEKASIFERTQNGTGIFLNISEFKPDIYLIKLLKSELFENDFDYIYLYDSNNSTYDTREVEKIFPYLKIIKEHLYVFLFCRFHMPDNINILDKLYDNGADGINTWCNTFYEKPEVIQYIPSLWASGTILFDLSLNAEYKTIIAAINKLTENQIIPILINKEHQTENTLKDIYNQLNEAIKINKINLFWLYHFPVSCDTENECYIPVVSNLKKMKLSKKISVGYSNLKRKLKVKTIRDSFDSTSL